MATSPNGTSKLMVRLPADLHRRLRARAEANERSLNSEIVYALKRYDSAGGEARESREAAPDDEALLRQALARAERGEGVAVSEEEFDALVRELRDIGEGRAAASATLDRLQARASQPEATRAGA